MVNFFCDVAAIFFPVMQAVRTCRLLNLFGIESPGLTSALSLAEEVLQLVEGAGFFGGPGPQAFPSHGAYMRGEVDFPPVGPGKRVFRFDHPSVVLTELQFSEPFESFSESQKCSLWDLKTYRPVQK